MKISDAAIEAAAMAIFGVDPETWAMQTTHVKDRYRWDAQAALEAASPHLLAEAWDEGYVSGKTEFFTVANPYRK